MRTLDNLIEHLKKHKDAVIILGPGIDPNKKEYDIADFNEHYNRKQLRRNPEALWNFFESNIYRDINYSSVYDAVNNIDHSLIVDQNNNGSIAATYLHGHINLFSCQKCKTTYTINSVKTDEGFNTECEICGSAIRPSVLLSGERYNQVQFDELKESLLNTHTLFLIGMDYSEEALLNLICDYGDMKAQINSDGNPENERMIVVVQSKEEDFDPNEIVRCEFLVKDDIPSAMERLMKSYK